MVFYKLDLIFFLSRNILVISIQSLVCFYNPPNAII